MQPIDEGRKALAASIDRDVRYFAVQRIAHFKQLVRGARVRSAVCNSGRFLSCRVRLNGSLTLARR